MKTLIVIEGNCGNEGQQYKKWLEQNLPDNIELDFREGCCGVGGGLFDEDNNIIEGGGNEWWNLYCNS
jgi:hypothetical protein